MNPSKKVVVVTGASSGIGKAIAEKLKLDGHEVYGTSRKPSRTSQSEMPLLELDICSPDSVTRFINTLRGKTRKIDVLINNAGIGTIGPAEEMSLTEVKKQFETNFFGLVSMTNAVLPMMREERSGQIINISSLGGLTGIPFQAFYSASKHAVEGYSESLSWEVKPFGISVHLVEPGFIKTGMEEHFLGATGNIQDYNSIRELPISLIKQNVTKGAPPSRVADAISKLVAGRSCRFRTRVGQDALWVPRLKKLIPHFLYSKAIVSKFGLPKSIGSSVNE